MSLSVSTETPPFIGLVSVLPGVTSANWMKMMLPVNPVKNPATKMRKEAVLKQMKWQQHLKLN